MGNRGSRRIECFGIVSGGRVIISRKIVISRMKIVTFRTKLKKIS